MARPRNGEGKCRKVIPYLMQALPAGEFSPSQALALVEARMQEDGQQVSQGIISGAISAMKWEGQLVKTGYGKYKRAN